MGGHGQTAVLVGSDDVLICAPAVADTIRPSARTAVEALQSLGLECVLLTGDNESTARAVAGAIGVTKVIVDALPADKVTLIHHLQDEALGRDGRRRCQRRPGVSKRGLGLAVGSGTDVAINAADLIIARDDLCVVATAIALSRRTITTIRGNLVWAFAYNLAALPVAACGLLNPLIAGAAMALSSGFVVWNSGGSDVSPGRRVDRGGPFSGTCLAEHDLERRVSRQEDAGRDGHHGCSPASPPR